MSDERTEPSLSRAGAEPMDLDALTDEVLPILIARLRASGLGELEIARPGWRVRLRRAPQTAVRATSATAAAAGMTDPSVENGSEARSPAVGYFQPAERLRVGRAVQAGDILGSVDVLGIVQDVNAPVDGIISRVLAEAGQAVEYGQALAEIDPLALATIDEPDRPAESVS